MYFLFLCSRFSTYQSTPTSPLKFNKEQKGENRVVPCVTIAFVKLEHKLREKTRHNLPVENQRGGEDKGLMA